MLQIYENPRSRAIRCLWMLEEIGRPYQLVEKTTRADDLQTAEYLRLNPNARIPTLVIEHLLLHLLEHRALLAEFSRDPSAVERNELLLKKPLAVLNDALAGRSYLAG